MNKILLFESQATLDSVIQVGQKRQVKANGKLICLVRTVSSLVAFYDQCPHLGAALSSGHLNMQDQITCPWHSYRFSLNTGEESERKCSGLKFIEVLNENDKTYLVI